MHIAPAARARMPAAAALLASSLLAGCALATPPLEPDEGSSDFSRPGAYLGVYGIQAYEQFQTSGSRVDTGNSDLGAGVKLGFRATPGFALEALAENVRGFDVDDGTVHTDLDILNFGLAGKCYLLEDRFQPYLLGGAGLARPDVRGFDIDEDSWFLRGGLGIDIYLTSNFALFGEANYNRMMGGGSKLHHIDAQAGVLFRF
jgi:hypothetical protein